MTPNLRLQMGSTSVPYASYFETDMYLYELASTQNLISCVVVNYYTITVIRNTNKGIQFVL